MTRERISQLSVFLFCFLLLGLQSCFTPGKKKAIRNEVFVQGGTFQMGMNFDDYPERSDGPHTVTVSNFWIMNTEVTQKLYYIDQKKPDNSYDGGPNFPVINVTWVDAVYYANFLSEKDRLKPVYSYDGNNWVWDRSANGWRLPSEAEWEYAAVGGQSSQGYTYAGSNDIDEVAWYGIDFTGLSEVGMKAPNELGLYDMSGNVSEWCWDLYTGYKMESQIDPTGGDSGTRRVLRGGDWHHDEVFARSRFRGDSPPENYGIVIGFRLVRSAVK